MISYINKHVVVTGGAKGIGAACVKEFQELGARVSYIDTDFEYGVALQKRMGPGTAFYHGDVSSATEVQQLIRQIKSDTGDVDVLVNNAGIQRYATVTDTSEDEWDLVMNINLKSAFLCAKYIIPSMQKQGKGAIVNVASVQAFISQQNVAAYTTSKTALLGLTRSIAVDYAPHIRCVAVCPGTVDTPMLRSSFALSPDPEEVYEECVDMHLSGRIGTPSEVAGFIAYLASDRAGFITGQAFRIDGGLGVMIGGSKR